MLLLSSIYYKRTSEDCNRTLSERKRGLCMNSAKDQQKPKGEGKPRVATRRLLIGSFLLLMLMIGFALAPARFAHADEYIVTHQYFTAQNETWDIRLRSSHVQTSACINEVWASLVLISGSNSTLSNSQYIQVNTTFQYDLLRSSQFGSGAYTNMIPFSNGSACVNYAGNSINPPPGICASHL